MKTNKENMLRPSHTQMKEDGILLHHFIDFGNFMSRYAFDFLLFNRIKANSIQTNENAMPTNRIIQRDSAADCGRRVSYLALRAIKDGIGLRSDFSRAVVLFPVTFMCVDCCGMWGIFFTRIPQNITESKSSNSKLYSNHLRSEYFGNTRNAFWFMHIAQYAKMFFPLPFNCRSVRFAYCRIHISLWTGVIKVIS